MSGKKKVSLLLALFLMLLLPAFALSGCGGSSGSSSATPSNSSGSSSAPATLNATQLIENYHCGGCHDTEPLGLVYGQDEDFSLIAYGALHPTESVSGTSVSVSDPLSGLFASVADMPDGWAMGYAGNKNGSPVSDYAIIGMELAALSGTSASASTNTGAALPGSNNIPSVTSMIPAGGSRPASYTLPITVTFSEPVVIAASNMSVTAGGTAVTGTFSADSAYDGMYVQWVPASGSLSPNTTYTVTISGVTSSNGIPMPTYTNTFTTAGTAVADGQVIFSDAQCIACHDNSYTSTGQPAQLHMDGSLTTGTLKGPDLANTGNQNPSDYTSANLVQAVEEMAPQEGSGQDAGYITAGGTFPGSPQALPSGAKTQALLAIPNTTTPNTPAINDVVLYLQSLKIPSTVTSLPDTFLAGFHYVTVYEVEGCEMCHDVTTTRNGITTTKHSLVSVGAPDFDALYAMAGGTNSSVATAVSGMVSFAGLLPLDNTVILQSDTTSGNLTTTTGGVTGDTELDIIVNYLRSIAAS